ncbi:MAG: 4Fe-4S dicluster domain-containing protein [Deltaproteobacteria bacterium]|nr:4Fe-4S dicluster domain-containing protein [Deltaproteobacteria bacterium]
MAARKRKQSPQHEDQREKVRFYPAWCKRCGNCAAFCPQHVIEMDQWGYPHAVRTHDCISCHMCEKLCPDFAVTVGEETPSSVSRRGAAGPSPGTEGSLVSQDHSPERLAKTPHPDEEEHD